MVDYLKTYLKDGHLDIPQLINDDYFRAIKLLFNSGHYVSGAKLLMSFVDTIAFIELGNVRGNFVHWLQKYAILTSIGIDPQELREFRNGLLHMTNLHSRSVRAGSVTRLIMYVGTVPKALRAGTKDEKYFNLEHLIDEIAVAVAK